MKSFRKELWFDLPQRMGFVNITGEVERCLRESGVSEGIPFRLAGQVCAGIAS